MNSHFFAETGPGIPYQWEVQLVKHDDASSDGHIVSENTVKLHIETSSLAVFLKDLVTNSYVLQCGDPGPSNLH